MRGSTHRSPSPYQRLYQHAFRIRWKWRPGPGFRVPVTVPAGLRERVEWGANPTAAVMPSDRRGSR